MTTRMSVYTDKDLKDKLTKLAKESNNSVSFIVNKVLRENLDKYKIKGPYQL